MDPAFKIKMALLAANVAKQSLELLSTGDMFLAKLHFVEIVKACRQLDAHISGVKRD